MVVGDFTLTGAVNVGEFFWLTWCTRRDDTLNRWGLEVVRAIHVSISITRGLNDLDFDLTSGLDCSYISSSIERYPRSMIGISNHLANLGGVEVKQFYGWLNWHEGWSVHFPSRLRGDSSARILGRASLTNCEICPGCTNIGYFSSSTTITPPRVDPISGTWTGLGEQETIKHSDSKYTVLSRK